MDNEGITVAKPTVLVMMGCDGDSCYSSVIPGGRCPFIKSSVMLRVGELMNLDSRYNEWKS